MKNLSISLMIFLVLVSILPSSVLHYHNGQLDFCTHLISMIHETCGTSDQHDDHHHHAHHHGHSHDDHHGHHAHSDCEGDAADHEHGTCSDNHDADTDPVNQDWLVRQRNTWDGIATTTVSLPIDLRIHFAQAVAAPIRISSSPLAARPPPSRGITHILQSNHALLF